MSNTPRVAGHPGFVLLTHFMWPVGCGIARLAQIMDVSVLHVQGLIAGSIDVDHATAVKLSTVFGRTPGFWLALQSKHDAWMTYLQERELANAAQSVEASVALKEHLEPAGMTIEQLARRLRLPVRYMEKLLNGSGKLYAALADRLAETFGTTREYWLNMLPKPQAALA